MDETEFLSRLRLDKKSGPPLYVQLESQIKAAVGSTIHPGDRLPTIRTVATTLVIDQQAIIRTYKALEAQGVIETRHGKGSYIRQLPPPMAESLQTQRVHELANSTITTARTIGIDPRKVGEAIIAAVVNSNEVKP